ncbi:unnamed protein product [Parnassius apollo]|uniref:(apollo) hypothetical protein n=1 Tax=Parnassius apollo TaxID=110799 RepID=A0A8S3XHA7_PARAO|nr:unnamed protein product [Parnassius apollo]
MLVTNKLDLKLDDLAEMADNVMDNLRSKELLAVDAGLPRSTSLTLTMAEVNIELLIQIRTWHWSSRRCVVR